MKCGETHILEKIKSQYNNYLTKVIAEFTKYGAIFPKRPQFFFWEKSHVSEIDLIVQTQRKVIPVEIKRTSTENFLCHRKMYSVFLPG